MTVEMLSGTLVTGSLTPLQSLILSESCAVVPQHNYSGNGRPRSAAPTNMLKILIALAIMFGFGDVAQAQSSSQKLELGYVDEGAFGCGCSMSRNVREERDMKFILVAPMDDATYIQLNGKNIKLRLVAESKRRRIERVGDRAWETYAAEDVTVRVDYMVTRVCGPREEDCEVTNYRATMTITRGNQRLVVKGLASCGC